MRDVDGAGCARRGPVTPSGARLGGRPRDPGPRPGARLKRNGARLGGRPRGASRDWPLAAGLAAGVALDALIGDPRRGHPVSAFGRLAAALETGMYADSRLRGALHTGACLAVASAPAVAAHRLTRDRPLPRAAALVAGVWAVTGARSLRQAADRAALQLDAGDLAAARAVLPALCSRDPSRLGPAELARAVVESVAENTSDAAVAPLLWAAAAGLPGLAAYRAVNTLDAMVGYRSARYRRFGWAAARLDDVANWAPARLTAVLAAACSPVAAGSPGAALRAARRDGGRHPSPNAGYPEAAFAGALGLRLGGASSYQGVTESRPELGHGRPPEPGDIRRAQRLSRAVTTAATALAALVALLAAQPRAVPRDRRGFSADTAENRRRSWNFPCATRAPRAVPAPRALRAARAPRRGARR
jgi:adenosylcobinamide-phosphate synthase